MKKDPDGPNEHTVTQRQLRDVVPPRGNYQSGAGRQPCPMLSLGKQAAQQSPTAGPFHPSQPCPRFVAPVCLPFTRSHPGNLPPGFAHPPAYWQALFQVSDRSPSPLHSASARSGFSGPAKGVHQALHLPNGSMGQDAACHSSCERDIVFGLRQPSTTLDIAWR